MAFTFYTYTHTYTIEVGYSNFGSGIICYITLMDVLKYIKQCQMQISGTNIRILRKCFGRIHVDIFHFCHLANKSVVISFKRGKQQRVDGYSGNDIYFYTYKHIQYMYKNGINIHGNHIIILMLMLLLLLLFDIQRRYFACINIYWH